MIKNHKPNRLKELTNRGQSIWFDYVSCSLIHSGQLQKLIHEGVCGATSNPNIFKKAIAETNDYDKQLYKMTRQGMSAEEIYDRLTQNDIKEACDLFLPTFKTSKGVDGYVSLEVLPNLAHDFEGTVEEAERLWKEVNRPNLMIKVPATKEGFQATSELIGKGINVNVTLIFSTQQYKDAAKAYIDGLEKLAAKGGDMHSVSSAASVFISRIDTKVDSRLSEIHNTELQGKTALNHAVLIYDIFQKTLLEKRWEKLTQKGARIQRVLWASTSTKNEAYSDTYYVENLIAPHTVNTLPPHTLQAFIDHGDAGKGISSNIKKVQDHMTKIHNLGIDVKRITEDLAEEGIKDFAQSYTATVDVIKKKINSYKNMQ